jgi:hypothetical protein
MRLVVRHMTHAPHAFLPVSTINITLRPHPSISKLKHGHVDTNHLRPRIPEHRTRVLPPSLPSPWRYPHSQHTSTFPQAAKSAHHRSDSRLRKAFRIAHIARRSKRGSDDGKSRRQRRRARDDDVLGTSNSYGSDGSEVVRNEKTVSRTCKAARAAGVPVLTNSAPTATLPDEM